MGFKDKYTTATLNEAGKIKVTDDSYLQAELIEMLISSIDRRL